MRFWQLQLFLFSLELVSDTFPTMYLISEYQKINSKLLESMIFIVVSFDGHFLTI